MALIWSSSTLCGRPERSSSLSEKSPERNLSNLCVKSAITSGTTQYDTFFPEMEGNFAKILKFGFSLRLT